MSDTNKQAPIAEPACTWREPDRTGMRYPEQSELSGGATDCAPAPAVDERIADSDSVDLAAAPEQHGELPEPVAWIDEVDFATLEADQWCVVHAQACDPGASHNASKPLYTADQMHAAIAAERERNPWRMVMDDALVTAHLGVATDDPYDDLNRLLDWHHVIWLDPAVSSDAQALIDRGAAASEAELSTLRTVMIAAAEEIAAHWDAHCDAEGYGPQNLIRRLEEGIPSEYGYTAGRFAELQAELSTLRQQPAERTLLEQYDLEQSPDYRKGYEDGRLKGFEVGQRYAAAQSEKHAAELAQARTTAQHWKAEHLAGNGVIDALRAQVDAAVPAMRDYARRNPRWEVWDNGEATGKMQDPNGVNAWLEQFDAAIAAQGEAK